jgi:hypothetical protein
LEDVLAYLRKAIGLDAPVKPAEQPSLTHEMRVYVEHIMHRSGLSSLNWPRNWKSVMRGIYPAAEWFAMEPKLDARLANARVRESLKARPRGAA